ncbi:MAG: prepilin-type N-terminal cleavage/methylation domain-containing protein, partial [Deltaproteobacteria bacterium]|nr:prepilin-type N-terminal cleavage/methylation domain-containing protein [Deltaproteobacteria bacterium]
MRLRLPHFHGFTLVEVLAAVAVFAIVAAIVFGGFSQTMRNRAFVEAQSERVHVIRVAMDRMVREISSAYASIHVNPNPQLVTMRTGFVGKREGRGSRLDFTSFSHRRLYRDAHESDQNEISYFVAELSDDDGRRVLALMRREQNRVDEDFRKGGQVSTLVEGIKAFELRYLDPIALEWKESCDLRFGTNERGAPFSPRSWAQWLGTDVARRLFGEDVWVRYLL